MPAGSAGRGGEHCMTNLLPGNAAGGQGRGVIAQHTWPHTCVWRRQEKGGGRAPRAAGLHSARRRASVEKGARTAHLAEMRFATVNRASECRECGTGSGRQRWQGMSRRPPVRLTVPRRKVEKGLKGGMGRGRVEDRAGSGR
eukprot:364191-Chlamydomonas_euryale.AAC.5